MFTFLNLQLDGQLNGFIIANHLLCAICFSCTPTGSIDGRAKVRYVNCPITLMTVLLFCSIGQLPFGWAFECKFDLLYGAFNDP